MLLFVVLPKIAWTAARRRDAVIARAFAVAQLLCTLEKILLFKEVARLACVRHTWKIKPLKSSKNFANALCAQSSHFFVFY